MPPTRMKKPSAFNEAKPRTQRGEARRREISAARAIEDLLHLEDENAFRQRVTEDYGIAPEDPKYGQILAIWREYQRGKL